MNKRVIMMKRITEFAKKHRLPKNLIVFMMAVILFCFHLVSAIKNTCNRIVRFIFPNIYTALAYITIGFVMCILIMPENIKNTDMDQAYGNVADNVVSESQTDEFDFDDKNNTQTENNQEINDNAGNGKSQKLINTKTYSDEELKNMTFYIKVNRMANCITIYTADDNGNYTIPIKAMRCSTGSDNTPLGIFRTSEKYDFRKLLFGVYGQYATRITGQILFHSSSYDKNKKNSLISEEYNKLGEGVSHGCIRLTVQDAKWIYDYCKIGTEVEIYDDVNPGPLGKPETIKVPDDTKWDPTDESEENPWNECNPTIIGAVDKEINLGDSFNILDGITAYDTCGNDITPQIVATGVVDTSIEGVYQVNYSITDILGRKAFVTVNYTVKGSYENGIN